MVLGSVVRGIVLGFVLSTANPSHTKCRVSFLLYGMADRKFVITVAAQNNICPHGSTYPRNEVAIFINRIITRTDHV
jgi:hypothetical protein